jgi:CRISPR-associated protein Csm4
VVLDTVTHASSLFHFGRLIFHEGCGLFFLVRFVRDDIAEKFSAVLRLMGDEGIGVDRTTGSVNFRPQFSSAVPDFCEPKGSQWFVNLSPLFPKPKETSSLFADGCNYRLTIRSGWVGGVLPSSVRRKTVRMVCEGSVLCGSAEKVWGKMVDVTPNGAHHRVYRWGYAFPVACEVRPS